MLDLLHINPKKENAKITVFLKKTFAQQHITNAVIGMSGGIDSALSFMLLSQVLKPENIFPAHLFYQTSFFELIAPLLKKTAIPEKNIIHISIQSSVDDIATLRNAHNDHIRKGNIMARTRMIYLFDIAKAKNALVVGTENKTENLLGYFTRFGDQASDIEPISTLYKSQVYQLASYLAIPQEIIDQTPSAGLWHGQSDEKEFGFTYKEADEVLSLWEHTHMTSAQLELMGHTNAKKILLWKEHNAFKHQTPYNMI